MNSEQALFQTLLKASAGLTLSELLQQHPDIARRSAQRWLSQWLHEGKLTSSKEGRRIRYRAMPTQSALPSDFPATIPLSADSRDILAYVNQPVSARKPVGYQRDFLDSYQPNRSTYLPESLRRQLHKMGNTGASTRPAGTYGRGILNRLLIDLSWASSHLEGNTYSRLDTRALIEQGTVASGKALAETQMILNHKAAIELLIDNISTAGFNRYTVMNLHSALAENLLPNPADEGRLRQHLVEISHSTFRPLDVPPQIAVQFDNLLEKANQISDPFEQAFFVMVHIPYLQPFADVNKRTSRLAANLPLLQHNLCPLTFLGVPEAAYSQAILGVYEMTRVELLRDMFVWAYERSTQEYLALKQNLAEPDPLRLRYRDVIKRVIRDVVLAPDADPLDMLRQTLEQTVDATERDDLQALIIEELRRLHEGVLARYGLRPSEWERWSASQ
jgi:fido (protein-threonine AMPylation protein)